jgi:hypothetical protein
MSRRLSDELVEESDEDYDHKKGHVEEDDDDDEEEVVRFTLKDLMLAFDPSVPLTRLTVLLQDESSEDDDQVCTHMTAWARHLVDGHQSCNSRVPPKKEVRMETKV